MSQQPRRRNRHLIDLDNPRPTPRRDPMSTSQVQKWVMSVLATTTIYHLAIGIGIAAMTLGKDRGLSAEIGLLVISAAFGMIAVSVGFLIHGRSVLTPWLLAGWVPALVMAWLMFA